MALSATTLSPAYTKCADETHTCVFPPTISSPASVAFVDQSQTGLILYWTLPNNVACNSGSFGNLDPSPGHVKSCFVAPIPSDIVNAGPGFFDSNGNPAGWIQCANENGICNPNTGSPVDILYGAKNTFVYTNAPSTICTSAIFGDPIANTPKACFWRPSQTTPTPSPPTPPTPGPITPPITPPTPGPIIPPTPGPITPPITPPTPGPITPPTPGPITPPTVGPITPPTPGPITPPTAGPITPPTSSTFSTGYILAIILGVVIIIFIIYAIYRYSRG